MNAEEYKRKAQECRQLARTLPHHPEDRAKLETMARDWDLLAAAESKRNLKVGSEKALESPSVIHLEDADRQHIPKVNAVHP